MIPNLLLRELGEGAARYNQHTTDHSSGCCVVCRRFLRDMWQALTDEANWLPDPPAKQIQRLEDEIAALKAGMNGAIRATAPPIEPIIEEGDSPQGTFSMPPPPSDDE